MNITTALARSVVRVYPSTERATQIRLILLDYAPLLGPFCYCFEVPKGLATFWLFHFLGTREDFERIYKKMVAGGHALDIVRPELLVIMDQPG